MVPNLDVVYPKLFADIDECKKDPGICGFNAKCNNTMGNFTCSCLPGYNGTAGANCTDIDECSVAVSPCHGNAICNNTAPFFTCECEPGYSGNGFNCTGKHLPILYILQLNLYTSQYKTFSIILVLSSRQTDLWFLYLFLFFNFLLLRVYTPHNPPKSLEQHAKLILTLVTDLQSWQSRG